MKQIQHQLVEMHLAHQLKQEEQSSWWQDLIHFLSFQWVFPPFG